MILWAMVLILLGTLFYPYLEMQVAYYLLLFKHWKYQTHSSIIIAQANNCMKKTDIFIKLNDAKGAEQSMAECTVLLAKAKALREAFEPTIQNFRDRYIS